MKLPKPDQIRDRMAKAASDAAPRFYRAAQTRYAGPTDTRGSRVIVTRLADGAGNVGHDRLSVPWRPELGSRENHVAAAYEWLASDLPGEWLSQSAPIVHPCESGYIVGWLWGEE